MNKSKRIGRIALCLIVSLMMVMTLIPNLPSGLTFAADGDYPVPETSKQLIDNEDGTYTLKLSVTGSAKTETENPKVNVVFIMDRSGSMQESTGQSGYTVAQYGRYGHVGDEYPQLYYRNTYGSGYTAVGNNDNHSTVYTRSGTQGNYTYTEYTGPRYNQSNNMRRDQVAIAAATDLAEDLLSYNTAANPDTVEMAFVSFNDMASPGNNSQWTTSASTAETVIRGYTYQNNTGTNWEDALIDAKTLADAKHSAQPDEQMFIIFLTDGNPTRYVNNAGNQAGNGYETDENIATCYSQAAPRARELTNAGYELYNIGVFGNVDRMEDLTEYANGATADGHGDATYYAAANASALEAAFAEILRSITNSLSLADVKFTDGVTDMTHSTGVNGRPDNFQYTITVNGEETPWADAPAATVNNNKEVIWDLSKDKNGNDLTIADGVTVTCSFLVWPDQDAMDLIADLNNNKITYDSLTDAQKAQITGGPNGPFALKTNTQAKLEYSILENNDGTITKIPQDPITLTPPEPMPLYIEKLSLEKKWDDSLDPDQREEVEGEVVLDFYKDDTKYIIPGYENGITLTEAENWIKTDFLSIATGIMVSDKSPAYDATKYPTVEYDGETYCILETGHDYHFQEQDINSHYELTAYTYHPMLVDGVLHNLTFEKDASGNITGVTEGTEISKVSATNTIKGGVSIRKKVVDSNGTEVDCDEPFTITMHMLDSEGEDYSYDYRIYYGEKNPEYESHIVYNEDGTVKYSRTDHIYGTGEAEVTIYPGDEIRFVNVDAGTRYYVSETETVGYDLDGITYKVRYGDDPTLVDFTADQKVTIDGKTYYIMEGNSSGSVEVTNVKNNGDLKVTKSVVNGDTDKEFEFTLELKGGSPEAELTDEFKYVIYDSSDEEVSDGKIKSGQTFKLKDGQYIIVEGVPTGTKYTVTETEAAGYTTTVGETTTQEATGTIVLDETATAAFTNTYDATGTAILKVIKELSGATWPTGKTLTFTLAGQGGTLPTDTTEELTAPGTATFGAITYGLEDAGKTYTYTISEDGFGAGWTPSGSITATVKVTDNGDGTLKTEITYNPENDTITNTYDASGNATINVTKAITGAAWPTGKTIKLTLAGANNAPMPETTTATLSAAGSASFGPISYGLADAGKTYTYTVSEDGFGTGWAGSGDVTVTVEVKDDGAGNLVTDVKYSPENATITNTYTATGKATLEATKAIEGAAWPAGKTITFTLAGEGGTLPETKTVSLSEPGKATFGDITYTEADAGKTYTYTITEDGFGAGWTGAPGQITATVKVTDNGDGTLKTEVTYDPTSDTFTNTYKATGKATLEATKAIEGAGWPEGKKITFTLAGEGGTLPTDTTEELTAPGTATFGDITYTEADAGKTYTYTITEDGFGTGWTGSPEKITATVKVTDNGDGTLKTEVTYDPANKTFTNTYEAEGEAVLEATKAIEGAEWPEDATITFTLSGDGGTVPEENTVTLTKPGKATFEAIKYTEADAGKTYTYTINEDGFGTGWKGTPNSITATVKVTDNGDGTLKTEITYNPENATFTNTYKATGEANIEVEKKIEGAAWPTGKTLKVTLAGEDGAPMPEDTEAELTSEGKVNFGPIEYDESDAGKTYTYTITEGSFGDGWSGSPNQITATVKVTDNGDGTLKTEVTYSPENATFTNTYNASGSVDIEVKKALEGRDWIEGETYTFTLYDAEETKIEDKTVSEDNLVAAFSTINYTEEDAGKTFTYTVKETSTLPGGISNSGDITVTVEVADNGDGTLTATATYTDAEKEENDTITNKYDSEGEVELEAIKDLEGREWQEGETYTFTLKDAEGNVIDEQTVNSNSKVTFDAIEYTEEDMVDDEGNYVTEKTYTYTIEETTTLPDGMTNSGVITATVVVTDDGEGNITAEVTYDKDDTIVNTYESKGEATLKAKKALVGRAWLENEKYTFTLTPVDGAPMPKEGTTVDFTADGEKSFGTIKYTQEDMKGEDGKFLTEKTYKYTISETSTLPSGIEKSGDITATVVLKDDGNGNITATVTYDPDSDTIINTYTAEGSATLKAKKLLKGRDWMDSESYTFTLKDPNGTVVEEKTVTADGEITFAAINYDESDAGKTYTYTITETGNSSANVTASDPIQAKVEVIDNGDGTLKTNVTYTPEDDTIINTYVPTPVNAQINVNKTIDGYVSSDKGSSDNVFEFTLYDKDGKQVGDKITITTKEGTGTASFAPIQYTEVGEYTYTVKETLGSAAGYTYSTIEYPVVVTVTDDPVNGKLDASVSYGDYTVTSGDETLLDVINEFDMTDVDVTLTLTKTIDDQSNSAPDGTFTFKLYKDSVSEENFVEEKTITTKGLTGSVDFSKLTFDKSGEYTYVVVEEAGDVNGFTYDTTEHTYKIIIDDNFDAAILEVNKDSTLEAEITNIYKAKETSNILKVKKEINDTSGSAYETTFTFTLKDADGNKIDEVTVVGAEEGEFKAIEYDKAGTYEYTITEVAGDDKGYQYDTTEYKVTVTVEDKNGELVATSAYIDKTGESQTSLTVTNTYDPEDAKIVIQAEKKVDDKTGGAAGNPKTFTFELLDADGNVIETVSRVGGGTVTFSELTYSKVGEYNYTVREVAGDDKGYTYDTSEYPVTVTVTDPDKDGILKAAITVGDSVEFINPYEAEPTSAKIQVNKALAGRDLVEGEFTFKLEELVDGEAVEVGTATNTAKGKVTFDKIEYTMPGEYTYVVSEVVPEDTKGVLFDEGTIKVVVKVTDDGNGQLAAEVQYPDDKTFNNQYEPEGTYTPEVKKVLKGRDLKKNEFTFKMVGPDGKVYTAKNDADGNVVFDELEFGVDDIGETYTYTITEKKGDLKYVKYDDHEVTLTLTITDNGDGTLKIKADYDGNKTFTNKYKKPTPPKTGDTTQVLPYMLMFTAALLGLILVFRRRKAVRK